MRISEEKMSGVPLEPLMLKNMDAAGRDKIIDAFAHFYADMHSYEPIPNPVKYKMSYEMDFDALMDFVNGDMKKYFPKSDVSFVRKFYDHLAEIEYDSRLVWSHCDLFSGNVLYDSKKQKVSFIDFADVGYVFLQYDLLTPYLWDLGIANEVYERYLQYIKLKNLPVDATDKEKIKKISQYHHAIQILLDMDSDAKLFEMNNAEGKARIAERMRKMLAELHRIDFRN